MYVIHVVHDCWSLNARVYDLIRGSLQVENLPQEGSWALFRKMHCGKSFANIWILKGGYRGSPPSPAPVPSRFKIQIFA